MTAYYYASDNTSDPSRDGSVDHPFLDPSELPSPSLLSNAQSGHYFHCDTATNFSAPLRSTGTTTEPIIIGQWGSGARPIITAYRMIDASECFECDVNTSGSLAVLTIPPVGGAGSTNLWRVPKKFFGLYAGGVWGACTDIGNRAGNGKVTPSAAREWCGAVANNPNFGTPTTGVTGGYGVVYSVGNPVETYGGLFVSSFDETDWFTSEAYQVSFYTLRARGGITLSGLDLRSMYHASLNQVGYTSLVADLALHEFTDLHIQDVYRSLTVNGASEDPSYPSPNVRFSRLRAYDNYAKNLGNQFFDTSGNIGTKILDGRIYRNVVNGFARAYSTAGIYLPGTLTGNGGRILVDTNTICNGDAGNFWPLDGAALMVEENGSDVDFMGNFLWNNKYSININGIGGTLPTTNVAITNNVIIAPTEQDVAFCKAINVGSNTLAVGVKIRGNVLDGFVRAVDYNSNSVSMLSVTGNISRSSGPIAGSGSGSLYEAVRSETADTAKLSIDGNNFYGHYADLRIWAGTTYNSAPEVNNRITSDPSAELARLPVPVDPTVNYALQIRPGARIVNGAVDLRPGTRVA